MAPGNLGSCAAPLKKTELSLAQGKVGRGCRKLQTWEHELPSSFFHSWSLLAIFSPQDCSPVCPLPPCTVWMCWTHSFTAFHLCHQELSYLEGAGERSWGQPQGWEKKAGLECHWRASRFSKPRDLIPEPQLLPAVSCLLLTSGLQNPDSYSAQHFSPSHYNDKGDKRFLSQCSESI